MKDYKPLLNFLRPWTERSRYDYSAPIKACERPWWDAKSSLKELVEGISSNFTFNSFKTHKEYWDLGVGRNHGIGWQICNEDPWGGEFIPWRGEENAPTDKSNALLIEHSSFLLTENSFQCLEWDALSNLSSNHSTWLSLVVWSDGIRTVKCWKNKILGNTKHENEKRRIWLKTAKLHKCNQEEGILKESSWFAKIRICDGEAAGSRSHYLRAAKINPDTYLETLELLSLRS